MRRPATWGAVLVLLAGLVLVVRPWLTQQRDIPAEIPSPASVVTTDTVNLEPRRPVCFSDVVAERHAERFRFRVAVPAGTAPALSVDFTGPGYEYRAEIPPGLVDGQDFEAAIPNPGRDVPVEVCFRNRGKVPIGLYAANDRARSRSLATVAGEPVNKSVWFTFSEPRYHSIIERLPVTMDRLTVFRPAYIGVIGLWILAGLFVLAVPAAIVWAYRRGLSEDGQADPEPVDVNAHRPWWKRLLD